MFELVKYVTCVELLNNRKGVSIFQRNPLDTAFGSLQMYWSRSTLENPFDVEQALFVEEKVHVHTDSIFTSVCSYLYRVPGLLHDVIRNRFINSFFSSLPFKKLLSLSSRSYVNSIKNYSNRLLTSGDHFRSKLYGDAWKGACFNALDEINNPSNINKPRVMNFKRAFILPSFSSWSTSVENELKVHLFFMIYYFECKFPISKQIVL